MYIYIYIYMCIYIYNGLVAIPQSWYMIRVLAMAHVKHRYPRDDSAVCAAKNAMTSSKSTLHQSKPK